jgi:hypothetical protein
VKLYIDKGKKVLEVVDDIVDDLVDGVEELIPPLTALFNKITGIFSTLFYRLPCVIIIEGVEYHKTEQPVWGQDVDKIFWQSEQPYSHEVETKGWVLSKRIYEFEAKTMTRARESAREALREIGL